MRDKLLQAVTQMRFWQKEYFTQMRYSQKDDLNHGAGFALDEAKRYEKLVDKLLAELDDPQKTLFDKEETT